MCLCGPVSPPHERLVDGGPQVEDVITDGQVVFESEGVQNHTVPNRERQAELLVRITWETRCGRQASAHYRAYYKNDKILYWKTRKDKLLYSVSTAGRGSYLKGAAVHLCWV